MNKISHLLIGQGSYGLGESMEEAKANFKKNGAKLTGATWLYTFGASSEYKGVDSMGSVHYDGDEPVYSKIR